MLQAELPSDYLSTPHPSLPPAMSPKLSPLIEQELARKAASTPVTGGIDTSRYEALEAPSTDLFKEDLDTEWHSTLLKAYTSSTHLSTRLTNLALLEEFGKNAWLVGNSQLEDILRDLERELSKTKEETDSVNKSRKAGQEAVKGELDILEEGWRRGIGRVVEAEVAAEELRREILKKRREGAV